MSDHLPELSVEDMLQFGEIDLCIEEALRNLDDAIPDLSPVDRTLVILHMRWTYMDGYYNGHRDALDPLTDWP